MSAARVIIANEDHAEFAQLKKRSQTEVNFPLDEHSLNTYAEPVSWVERCLAKGYYFHDPLQKAPMGGRKPGADRNDFTAEDDTRLAQFIAKRIPNKSEGGRTGNNLYKDLCDRTFIHGLQVTPGSPGGIGTANGKRTLTQSSTITPQGASTVVTASSLARARFLPLAAAHVTFVLCFQSTRTLAIRPVPDFISTPSPQKFSRLGIGEYGYSRGKKRAIREDSPASADDRGKRRRSSNEPSIERRRDQNTSAKPTHGPRRKRPDPREPGSSPQERPRTSDTSAQRSNATTRLGHAAGDTADTTLGSGSDHTEYTQSAAVARTESIEAGPFAGIMDVPALDSDPNESNVSGHAPSPGGGLDLSSTYYGYDEFDRDVHDRARDLGLSDYLAQGFTSTW
ncbi:hypothetical protein FRC10_006535 [Ceratobasidium sp. 414]|nr:hypothetical protein FRC10_006535 [Ceratobasidium sp. 414]